jgi:type II secretory pathway pseudopilin PulG
MSGRRVRNQRGVTLVEAMAAVMIISFAIIGLVSSFIYGRFSVERSGVERKALEMLQGKMEHWQNQRIRFTESLPMPTNVGPAGKENVLLDADKDLRADIRSDISGVRRDGSLQYQEVTVTLTYDNGPFKDSLGLTTKMYLQQ